MNSKKILKFLSVGISAISFSQMAFATESSTIPFRDKVEKEVRKIIQYQYDKGFLTEKANIKVSILNNEKIPFLLNYSNKDMIKRVLGMELSTVLNRSGRLNEVCHVNLVFDDNGNIPHLTDNKEIFELTKLKNETQKKIARNFVALHEHFHCQFFNIENPVIAFNKDEEFNKKINYFLKDEISRIDDKSPTYIEILNENYADVAATLSLLKDYGENNPDLIFVLKTIILQRHANYIEKDKDTHFSHMSLTDAMSSDTVSKLKKINNSADFDKLVLEISNRGTQHIMVNKPNILNYLHSVEHLQISINMNALINIYSKVLSAEERQNSIVNNYPANITRGFSYDISQRATNKYKFEKLIKLHGKREKIEEYADIASHANMAITMDSLLNKDNQTMGNIVAIFKEFSSTFPEPTENINVINALFKKDDIQNKINILRADFSNKNNNMSLSSK